MSNVGVVLQRVEHGAQLGDVVRAVGLPARVVVAMLVHPSPTGRPGVPQARTVGAHGQQSIGHVSPLFVAFDGASLGFNNGPAAERRPAAAVDAIWAASVYQVNRLLRFAAVSCAICAVPNAPAYNEGLRPLAATLNWPLVALALHTSVLADHVWILDSPVEYARSHRDGPNAKTWPAGRSTATATWGVLQGSSSPDAWRML
jgi:hypothetical protein